MDLPLLWLNALDLCLRRRCTGGSIFGVSIGIRTLCLLRATGSWRLEVYANAAASIGGGEVGVMLEKVGSRTLGSGKTRNLCMPNHRQLKGQKSTT
jgi:hypothetical protein